MIRAWFSVEINRTGNPETAPTALRGNAPTKSG